ncbi:MAG: DMT family transporter [Bacteroidales bacterium]|nr:DMT family transporter [Bacteroidales bacterium]
MLIGETIALFVALSWTVTALFAEVGSKRMGSLPFNAIRIAMSLVMLALTLWLIMGAPCPRYADGPTWLWLLLSGLVGYVLGDYCLMQGYIIIGSRFGQLFMTLSAPTAALLGRLFLGEQMSAKALWGMLITLTGIAMSILSKQKDDRTVHLSLPARGIAYAAIAGICQGAGLVLSKVGMVHYDSALAASGMTPQMTVEDALVPLPLSFSIPFASTLIRCIMGLVGFLLMLKLFEHNGSEKLRRATKDRKAMWSAFASMLFGPFVGVSLSLMATRYTSTGIAQTLFALTPVLIIAPAAWFFHQKVSPREVLGAIISVVGVSLFFI